MNDFFENCMTHSSLMLQFVMGHAVFSILSHKRSKQRLRELGIPNVKNDRRFMFVWRSKGSIES